MSASRIEQYPNGCDTPKARSTIGLDIWVWEKEALQD